MKSRSTTYVFRWDDNFGINSEVFILDMFLFKLSNNLLDSSKILSKYLSSYLIGLNLTSDFESRIKIRIKFKFRIKIKFCDKIGSQIRIEFQITSPES